MSTQKKKHGRAKRPTPDQLQAQHRRDFFIRLQEFFTQIAGPDIFPLLPEKELDCIYFLRYRPVKVIAAPDQNIPSSSLRHVQRATNHLLQTTFTALNLGQVEEVTTYDFFTTVCTLITYELVLKEDQFPNADSVKKALAPLAAISNNEIYQQAGKGFRLSMNTIAMFNSDISTSFCTFRIRNSLELEEVAKYWATEMYYLPSEKIQIKVDGISRPAFRVAWGSSDPDIHLDYSTVSAAMLNLPGEDSFNVYIQSHGLNRLYERMDETLQNLLHYCIYDSFKKPKVCTNRQGDLLFEYRFFGQKTGYFVGEIIENNIILRTFLFLTNNGTPEGDKLKNDTGLLKADKAYLAIDKLTTFAHSDIATNQKIKDIFVRAGCESLFNLEKGLIPEHNGQGERSVADFFIKYMNLDETRP